MLLRGMPGAETGLGVLAIESCVLALPPQSGHRRVVRHGEAVARQHQHLVADGLEASADRATDHRARAPLG